MLKVSCNHQCTCTFFLSCRHYFAESKNPGEQFHLFSNLAVWLINHQGSGLDQPQEVGSYSILCVQPSLSLHTHPQFDDPNGTVATILSEAKQMVSPHKTSSDVVNALLSRVWLLTFLLANSKVERGST